MTKTHLYIENHLNETEARWFAVRTKYKHEKKAFELLQRNHIEVYLPLKKLTKRYERKIRYVQIPLIHSFVFIKIVKKQYLKVLQNEYIIDFVKFGKNLIAIPDSHIQLLNHLTSEGISLEVEPCEFREGVKVQVIKGILLGTEGRLVNFKGKKRLEIELSNFEYSLLVEIDDSILKIIN